MRGYPNICHLLPTATVTTKAPKPHQRLWVIRECQSHNTTQQNGSSNNVFFRRILKGSSEHARWFLAATEQPVRCRKSTKNILKASHNQTADVCHRLYVGHRDRSRVFSVGCIVGPLRLKSCLIVVRTNRNGGLMTSLRPAVSSKPKESASKFGKRQ